VAADFVLADEVARLELLRSEWDTLLAPPPGLIEDWAVWLEDIRRSEAVLREAGQWVRGPADLLGVLRLDHDEVRHCLALAWLLDPEGVHGLGTRLLRRLLDRCAPGYELSDRQRVSVVTEETRAWRTADETRADVLVDCGDLALVIEAKANAGEQDHQAYRLVQLWATGGIDCRFVFLTKDGRIPVSAGSHDQRWVGLSCATVRSCVAAELDNADPSAPGRHAAEEWLAAARRVSDERLLRRSDTLLPRTPRRHRPVGCPPKRRRGCSY
jgi:PD-(D/E)XK nuclease superfamily